MKIRSGSKSIRVVRRIFFWVILTGSFIFSSAEGAGLLKEDSKIAESLLAENWQELYNILDSVEITEPSVVLRQLKAYTSRFLNNNQEASNFFGSVTKEERKEWQVWVEELAEQHPQNAIALYFKGDMARSVLEDYDLALDAFNQGLKMYPKHSILISGKRTSESNSKTL